MYNDNDQDKELIIVLLRQHNLLCDLPTDCVLKIQNQILNLILMVGIESHLEKHNYVPVFGLHILHILFLLDISFGHD